MSYFLYIFLGLAPSLIWLLFFLKKDVHPEPKGMVLKIFIYGALMALPAAFLEWGIGNILLKLKILSILRLFLNYFLGVALTEEILKYLVVRKSVIGDKEFDEPVDILLYMIIAALGFAAVENVLLLMSFQFSHAVLVSGLRFIGATFLHALCSGLLGFFLALSFFEIKEKTKLTIYGITLAVFLHGLYDFSIIAIGGNLKFLIPIIIIVSLAIAVTLGFKKAKKLASVCKIK